MEIKTFQECIDAPLNALKNSNFITLIELTAEVRLGLYYLARIYDIGFRFCERAGWEFVALSQSEDSEFLTAKKIRELSINLDEYEKCKYEFENGQLPDGFKKMIQNYNIDSIKPPKTFEYLGEFGWLDRLGNFTPSGWGEHTQSAERIIQHLGFEYEFKQWRKKQSNNSAGDYLCSVKGYALIHNPSADGGYIVTNIKPLTKKQKEFLYDYFTALGKGIRANMYIDD